MIVLLGFTIAARPDAAFGSCYRCGALFEPQLSPRFVYGHGHSVGQIKAAAAFAHGQAQAVFAVEWVEYLGRQATAFRAEDKRIALGELNVVERLGAFGSKREQTRVAQTLKAAGQISMTLERRVLVVVESGTAQALVVQFKTDRLDQMQVAATVGAQPDNVAGIRRNFWLKKDDVKHARLRI